LTNQISCPPYFHCFLQAFSLAQQQDNISPSHQSPQLIKRKQ
jgi:hypothetical protein